MRLALVGTQSLEGERCFHQAVFLFKVEEGLHIHIVGCQVSDLPAVLEGIDHNQALALKALQLPAGEFCGVDQEMLAVETVRVEGVIRSKWDTKWTDYSIDSRRQQVKVNQCDGGVADGIGSPDPGTNQLVFLAADIDFATCRKEHEGQGDHENGKGDRS